MNYFVKHKRTLGNKKLIGAILGIIWVVYIIFRLVITPNQIMNNVLVFLQVFVLLTEMFIVAIVWRRFPSIKDNLHIRNELKFTLRFSLSIIVSYFIFYTIVQILVDDKSELYDILISFVFNISYFFLSGLLYICVVYVIKRNKCAGGTGSDIDKTRDYNEYANQHHTQPGITLSNVLGHKQCFQTFMEFLVRYIHILYNIYDPLNCYVWYLCCTVCVSIVTLYASKGRLEL